MNGKSYRLRGRAGGQTAESGDMVSVGETSEK